MLRQAVFLVGGRGTRLGSLTDQMPKPLMTISGRPFIGYLVDNAVRHGLTDIILLAGYRGDLLEAVWGEESAAGKELARDGVRIRVVTESVAVGTAGALVRVNALLDEQFLLANGDSFFDFNWLDLLTIGGREDWLGRLALRVVADGSRYGGVDLDEERISAFHSAGRTGEAIINAGVYLLRRELLNHIDRVPMSLEHEVFPRLSGRLHGRVYDGYFIDIGIPADLARADREIATVLRRPAAFLDRDGVLNTDRGYVHRVSDFEWIPGAKAAIKRLNDSGHFVFVITNQAGVAHGFYSEDDVMVLHRAINAELQDSGAHVDWFEYCPHHPDGAIERYRRTCDRRKPAAGMIRDCLRRWPVDTEKSFLIGDKPSDTDAAANAGITGHLFTGGNLLDFLEQIRTGWTMRAFAGQPNDCN